MNTKTIVILSALFVLLLATVGNAAVIPLTIDEVKVNGDTVSPSGTNSLSVTRDQDVVVKVKVSAYNDLDGVEITAFIGGYEYSRYEPISDTVGPFSLDANTTTSKYLNLRLPFRVEEDNYLLRVVVYDRNSNQMIENYKLKVDTERHRIIIRDVVISPSDGRVEAGRALLTTVRVQNIGEKDENQVKVRVEIPELGISATDYIDELQADESTTTEELYMRIPQCAKEGEYTLQVSIEYDEYFAEVTDRRVIEVLNPCDCSVPGRQVITTTTQPSDYATSYPCTECPNLGCAGTTVPSGGQTGGTTVEKTVITIGPETQEVAVGASVSYLLSLNNQGSGSRTYVVSVQGADEWADVRMSPSNVVVVGAGETKAIYLHVAPKSSATDGEKMFTVSVRADDKALKEVVLRASVKGKAATGGIQIGRSGLEIGFFVLLALLVILALVIVFSKLKGPDKEEPEEDGAQTYY